MVNKVENLKASAHSIRNILQLLNHIANQTNILSLNVAIEASRAGAAGKGFMVVASEITNLADQSKQSIERVGTIMEKIQGELQETIEVLGQVYPMFQDQLASAKDGDRVYRQVQVRMDTFTRKIEEVTHAIDQLEATQIVLSDAMVSVTDVAQQSSATSEEVALLANQQLHVSNGLVRLSMKLEELSDELKGSLSKFKL